MIKIPKFQSLMFGAYLEFGAWSLKFCTKGR